MANTPDSLSVVKDPDDDSAPASNSTDVLSITKPELWLRRHGENAKAIGRIAAVAIPVLAFTAWIVSTHILPNFAWLLPVAFIGVAISTIAYKRGVLLSHPAFSALFFILGAASIVNTVYSSVSAFRIDSDKPLLSQREFYVFVSWIIATVVMYGTAVAGVIRSLLHLFNVVGSMLQIHVTAQEQLSCVVRQLESAVDSQKIFLEMFGELSKVVGNSVSATEEQKSELARLQEMVVAMEKQGPKRRRKPPIDSPTDAAPK